MILAITLMASLFVMPVVAEEPVFTDMPDDWTTSALKNAVKNGLLNGYDGKIMPNDNIKRSEMAAILVRAFGATKEADISSFKRLTSATISSSGAERLVDNSFICSHLNS